MCIRDRFQSYLGAETIHRAGAQHVLNAEYFQRIDALKDVYKRQGLG